MYTRLLNKRNRRMSQAGTLSMLLRPHRELATDTGTRGCQSDTHGNSGEYVHCLVSVRLFWCKLVYYYSEYEYESMT